MTSSLPIEPIYVVDTNALIWYLIGSNRLSRRAATIFEAAEGGECQIYVSAIIVAEMYFADKKWRFFDDFAKTYADIKSKPYFRFFAFNADDVMDFGDDAAVPEMHDRMIAGFARRLNAPLITSDHVIAAANLVRIVW